MNKPNFEDLSDEIKEALLGRLINKAQYESMSVEDLFYEYCQWNGLIGWGYALISVINELRGNT